ncbi:MAG: hypothetical protein KC492_40975, partial [Myxococcales bacterium]|nr:hypothetical protein [Myxococcales bacterium]
SYDERAQRAAYYEKYPNCEKDQRCPRTVGGSLPELIECLGFCAAKNDENAISGKQNRLACCASVRRIAGAPLDLAYRKDLISDAERADLLATNLKCGTRAVLKNEIAVNFCGRGRHPRRLDCLSTTSGRNAASPDHLAGHGNE